MSTFISPIFRFAHMALWLCALIWGAGFVFQKMAMSFIPPLLFNTLRSLLGAGVLFVFILLQQILSTPKQKWINAGEFKLGIGLGICLWLALATQQVGLVETMVYRASLITGLYVVLVPFVRWIIFSKAMVSWQLNVMVLGGLGLFLLTTSEGNWEVGHGDLMVLLSTAFWAVHVGLLGQDLKNMRVLQVAFVQMLCCAVLSGISSAILREPLVWQHVVSTVIPLMYAGILSSGLAYALQIYGQNKVAAPVAAMILSVEAIVGASAGWYLLDEPFSMRSLMGALLIMLAIVLVELTSYLEHWMDRLGREKP